MYFGIDIKQWLFYELDMWVKSSEPNLYFSGVYVVELCVSGFFTNYSCSFAYKYHITSILCWYTVHTWIKLDLSVHSEHFILVLILIS